MSKLQPKSLLLVTLVFALGVFLGTKLDNLRDQKTFPSPPGDSSQKHAKTGCSDSELYLDKLNERVKNNPTALTVIKDKCLWVLHDEFFDATGDEKKELFMITSGAGCGSCHGQELYVFSDEKEVFHFSGQDILVGPIDNLNKYQNLAGERIKQGEGFITVVPIRLPQESLGGVTRGVKTVYGYNEKLGFSPYYGEIVPYDYKELVKDSNITEERF